mgnify:CR=1 FL=1
MIVDPVVIPELKALLAKREVQVAREVEHARLTAAVEPRVKPDPNPEKLS